MTAYPDNNYPNDRKLGTVAGFAIHAIPAAIYGTVGLWIVFTIIGLLLRFDLLSALVGGFLALILHWGSEFIHQFGHALAARSTGYPMLGIRLGVPWGLFAGSIYPENEPVLSNRTHLQRVSGGPIASLILTIIAGIIAAMVHSVQPDGLWWWLSLFFFVENLFIYTLQSLVPLGFNDGSTILRALTNKQSGW